MALKIRFLEGLNPEHIYPKHIQAFAEFFGVATDLMCYQPLGFGFAALSLHQLGLCGSPGLHPAGDAQPSPAQGSIFLSCSGDDIAPGSNRTAAAACAESDVVGAGAMPSALPLFGLHGQLIERAEVPLSREPPS